MLKLILQDSSRAMEDKKRDKHSSGHLLRHKLSHTRKGRILITQDHTHTHKHTHTHTLEIRHMAGVSMRKYGGEYLPLFSLLRKVDSTWKELHLPYHIMLHNTMRVRIDTLSNMEVSGDEMECKGDEMQMK